MIQKDNKICDYIAELNLQFELRDQIRRQEEMGVTIGTEKLKKLLENSTKRCRKIDAQIQEL